MNATFGHVVSSRRFALWTALALVLATGLTSVKADTIVEQITGPYGGIGFLPQFDPAYGQLIDVGYSFSGSEGLMVYVGNPTSQDTAFTVYMEDTIGVSLGCLSVFSSVTGGGGGFIYAYSPPILLGGGVFPFYGSGDTSLAADLNYFTGTGSVEVYVGSGTATFSSDPPSLMPYVQDRQAWLSQATLTYTYEPVPEPSVLTLLVGGLALLGLRCKR